MSVVQWQFAASVDGFVAGVGGDMGWPAPFTSLDEDAMAPVIAETAVLLVGGVTFRGDDPFKGTPGEGEAYGGGWEGPQVVVTRNPPPEAKKGIAFMSDLRAAVDQARELAGDGNVGVLGASVGSQLVELGQVDEILVQYVPVLLGDGTRMFQGGTTELSLKQALSSSLNLYVVG